MSEMTDDQVKRVLAEKVMGWPVIDWDEPFSNHVHKGGVIAPSGPGAIRIGVIPEPWSPTTNRNDLAEVLAKLNDAQWESALASIRKNTPYFPASLVDPQNMERHLQGAKWLLTCDPAIIAGAVAEVVGK